MLERNFLEYNEKNIIQNLLQAQTHASFIKEEYKPEHLACISKHLLEARGELIEAIAHSSVVSPEKKSTYEKALNKVDKLIEDIKKGKKDIVDDIRNIRKDVESVSTYFKTSECRVCSSVEELFSKLEKDLNIKDIKIYVGESKMEATKIVAGQFVGAGVYELVEYLNSVITPGQPAWTSASTWIDIVGGLALTIKPELISRSPDTQFILQVTGSHLLVRKIIELLKGFVAPAPRAAPLVIPTAPAPAAPVELITVD